MAITANGTKTINSGAIADLDSNVAVDSMALSILATAGDVLDIDVTDKRGVLVKANLSCTYSIDGGASYIAFEQEAATKQYLNVTVGLTTVKVKADSDSTALVVMKA
jgi:hypothetical protein